MPKTINISIDFTLTNVCREALGLMFQFGTLLIVLLTFIFNNRKK
ncbi:putative holin-like toxin [Streptococcus suis]